MNLRPALGVGGRRLFIVLMLGAVAFALWYVPRHLAAKVESPTHLTLLVPDGTAADDVNVLAWQDAAAETGFLLEVTSASQLIRQGGAASAALLIVPDVVHRRMNDALVAHLERLVREGAKLMLVHDAGIAKMDGLYHPHQSRLSALAGVRYAMYGELGTDMLRNHVPWIDAPSVALLRLPPGKLMREGSDSPLSSAQPPPRDDEDLAVVSYHYGRLRYPVFKTAGAFAGRRLMHSEGGNLLAGVHAVGAGEVLFVNLPLTYLKLRTDGFFLHAFLRYFAQDMAQMPQFSPMPLAEGALIMNWHIDSAAAVPAMERLTALGAFEQGPYSVHLTAGPDVDVPGDGLGMNLATSETMRAWVRFFATRGDELGSHGGWIHNEFGRLIGTQQRALSAELIERNSAAVSQASGSPVREYSAPTGNHPAWVTPWLRERGIHAFYFTGDIGMAPTRSYQDGLRGPPDMWAFPVLSYGSFAAFEEAGARHVPEAHMAAWLKDVADFCVSTRTVRLVYFHPPGVAIFPQAFAEWLRHTKELVDAGKLRWTTMAQHADFSNRRLQVQWQLQARDGLGAANGGLQLQARHAVSLDQMSWLLPAVRYAQPRLIEGLADVVRDGPYWRVTGGRTARIALEVDVLAPLRPPLHEATRT